MKQSEIKTDRLKQIESGCYRNQYLMYVRKSTDEPENQKNSLKYQKAENIRFALRERIVIAPITVENFSQDGIISESHSAFKEDTNIVIGENGIVQYRIERPKFHKLIHFLSKGYFKGVIVLCWDRISRNKGDEVVIRKLMKSGIEFRFVLATYEQTSSGALHMDIDGMFSEHHSRVTSEKVSLNIKNQREKGFCTGMAPAGYLNIGIMESKPVDPKRAPIITKLFELYATGEWSLVALTRFATDQGFTMPARKKKRSKEEMMFVTEDDTTFLHERKERLLTASSLQRIFRNPFYVGKIKGNYGKYVESKSHEPLITEEIFAKVQIMLTKKNTSTYYSKALHYPLRGLLRCTDCKRTYTPYMQKGHIYYMPKCKEDCVNRVKNYSISLLTAKLDEAIFSICFTDEEIEKLTKYIDTDALEAEEKVARQKEKYQREKKKLKSDLSYISENKLTLLKTGIYSPESLLAEENKLNSQIAEIDSKEQCLEDDFREEIQGVIKLSELVKSLSVYGFSANPIEKEQLYRNVFSELLLSENRLGYKCKNGFEFLNKRFIANCALKSWLSELPSYSEMIHSDVRSLKSISSTMQQ